MNIRCLTCNIFAVVFVFLMLVNVHAEGNGEITDDQNCSQNQREQMGQREVKTKSYMPPVKEEALEG